jgi:hypothetical protein
MSSGGIKIKKNKDKKRSKHFYMFTSFVVGGIIS